MAGKSTPAPKSPAAPAQPARGPAAQPTIPVKRVPGNEAPGSGSRVTTTTTIDDIPVERVPA